MQDVEEQWLQHLGRVAPSGEVECLKAAERKRVLGIVEEESVLTALRPTVQPLLQFSDDVAETGNSSLRRLQYVNALNRIPQFALLLEVEPVTLLIAF